MPQNLLFMLEIVGMVALSMVAFFLADMGMTPEGDASMPVGCRTDGGWKIKREQLQLSAVFPLFFVYISSNNEPCIGFLRLPICS